MSMENFKPQVYPEHNHGIVEHYYGLVFDKVEFEESTPNPEADRGCVVEAMLEANRGSIEAHNKIETTIKVSCGQNLAMSCGRCGITLVRNNGIVYGATECPEVQSGQVALSDLA